MLLSAYYFRIDSINKYKKRLRGTFEALSPENNDNIISKLILGLLSKRSK